MSTPRRWVARSTAVLAASSLVLLGASAPVAAATAEDGLWYFDALHIQDAHDAGWTGKGVTIAVLDGQINPDAPVLAGADVQTQRLPVCVHGELVSPVASTTEDAEHGTGVVAMIVGNGTSGPGLIGTKGVAPDATVLYYQVSGCDRGGDDVYAVAIDGAVAGGADIISISLGFIVSDEFLDAVTRALHEGVIILLALSNQTPEDRFASSEEINGTVRMASVDRNGAPDTHGTLSNAELPNRNQNVSVAAPGIDVLTPVAATGWTQTGLASGTSFATPLVAGMLADLMQKYPSATSNQLLQSLIRNTGNGDHDLVWTDTTGYGVASLTSMLRVDPSQYPDVNPLLLDDGDPSPEEVAAGRYGLTTPTPTPSTATTPPTPTPTPTAAAGPPADGLSPWLIGGGIVWLLAMVALVILIVVLVRRRNQKQIPPAPPGPGGTW
jgi:subtilisin family serine protease